MGERTLKHTGLIIIAVVAVAALIAGVTGVRAGAVFTVNSTGNAQDISTGDGVCDTDAGTVGDQCTLRAAIEQANNDAAKDEVQFNIPTSDPGYDAVTGTFRIQPDSPLPVIGNPLIINGRSQPGFVDKPIIELNGLSAGVLVDGLRITAGNSEVRGLVINKFGQTNGADGIELQGGSNNVIEGNFIGVDVTGIITDPDPLTGGDEYGNSGSGIFINGSANNVIGGSRTDTSCLGASNPCNVISGAGRGLTQFNDAHGVEISGAGATGNVVKGNIIGLDVGGPEAGSLCSGNSDDDRDGVINDGCPGGPPTVFGATKDLGNKGDGVNITGVASNTVGGPGVGDGNVITANDGSGVKIFGGPEAGAACTASADNDGDGFVNDGCPQVGATAESGAQCSNSINDDPSDDSSVNDGCPAVQVASGNHLEGNLIGTTSPGTAVPPPGSTKSFYGVLIDGAPGNIIGTAAGAPDIISGNQIGVQIQGNSATGNTVQRNYVGTDVFGGSDLGNLASGIVVGSVVAGALNNTIGGTAPGAGNVVSGNELHGIEINNSTSSGNLVQGNFIGTDATGTGEIGNGFSGGGSTGRGVRINGSAGNTVGGTAAGRNVISGNITYGIEVAGTGATGNTIQSNYIGTDQAGTGFLGNRDAGIYINGAPNTVIGGTSVDARNVISGNGHWRSFIVVASGITISGSSSTGTQVLGNLIGTNVTGSAALGNGGDGIVLVNSLNNTVGGTTPGGRNIISGNGVHGVEIDNTATGNLVRGNYIGLNISGNAALGNGGDGVYISDAAANTVGGAVGGAGNVISGNVSMGVEILGIAASGNAVQANYVGTDAGGTADLGNGQHGVFINGAPNNTVGGTIAAARNVISGNGTGVFIQSGGATGNLVQGNRIGTTAAGTSALGNTNDGVRIGGNASSNTVGGGGSGAANAISYNGLNGVVVDSGTGNSILSNSIDANGTPTGLGIDLGLDGATTNDAGDPDTGANNLQNYPDIASATGSLVSTKVTGTLDSAASTAFTLQFFASSACDPSSHGEGATFLGSFSVTTNGSGLATYSNQSLPTGGSGGQYITATATDPGGNTSEFSLCALAGSSTDADEDGIPDGSDNCPLVPNTNQTDTDADGMGNACDPDDDGDKVNDVDETNCGSDPLNISKRPERIDLPGDDDGDGQVNEPLPPGSENYDCDGDGFKGSVENLIYSATGTGRNQDPCGENGWPADFDNNNALSLTDLASFIAPARRLGTSSGDPNYDARHDIVPGSNFGSHINIQDLAALITGPTAYPPMFGGTTRAFGQSCPWPP